MNSTRSAPCLMLTALFASPAFAAPVGKVSGENDTVVKKDMKKEKPSNPMHTKISKPYSLPSAKVVSTLH
jgi:hypothetical protein